MTRFRITAWALLAATCTTVAPAAPRKGGPDVVTERGHPLAVPGGWFREDDYPLDAKRAGIQGRVAVRASIDRSGQVVGCTVVESSGNASLDAVTCELVRTRGRFSVQKGAKGRPEPYDYTLPGIRWSLRAPLPTTVPLGRGSSPAAPPPGG